LTLTNDPHPICPETWNFVELKLANKTRDAFRRDLTPRNPMIFFFRNDGCDKPLPCCLIPRFLSSSVKKKGRSKSWYSLPCNFLGRWCVGAVPGERHPSGWDTQSKLSLIHACLSRSLSAIHTTTSCIMNMRICTRAKGSSLWESSKLDMSTYLLVPFPEDGRTHRVYIVHISTWNDIPIHSLCMQIKSSIDLESNIRALKNIK